MRNGGRGRFKSGYCGLCRSIRRKPIYNIAEAMKEWNKAYTKSYKKGSETGNRAATGFFVHLGMLMVKFTLRVRTI